MGLVKGEWVALRSPPAQMRTEPSGPPSAQVEGPRSVPPASLDGPLHRRERDLHLGQVGATLSAAQVGLCLRWSLSRGLGQ